MKQKSVKVMIGTQSEVQKELEAFQSLMTIRGSSVDWSASAPSIAFAPNGAIVVAVTLTWVTDL